MRALLLLVVVMLVGLPVAFLGAAPVPKEVPRPPLLDCTGPKGADAKTVRVSQIAWVKFLGEKSHEKKMALDKEGKVLIDMVLVPPGKYYRGSPEGKGLENDRPQKVITISKPMWVGTYEVTQFQYIAVTGKKNPSEFAKVGEEAANYPVERLSYDDAVAFCQLAMGGKLQLLTEAQWEYAYRAGNRTEWNKGDDEKLVEMVDPFEEDKKTTAKVGSKVANAFGLYDMTGNVWERCSGWFPRDTHAGSLGNDPVCSVRGMIGVGRGGSWYSYALYCREADRNWPPPLFPQRNFFGFRVCVILD